MRTITTSQEAIYRAARGSFPVHFRAFLSNDNGTTWQNLRELAGRDWLQGVTWEETIDQGVTEARVIITREQSGFSLSPEMTGSALNQVGGIYTPLLQRGKTRVKIEVAPTPLDSRPASGDWINTWEGYLCGIADAGDGMLELFCRDLLWPVVRTFIERERPYGDATVGVDVEKVIRQIISDNYTAPGFSYWQPGFTYGLNSKVVPTPGHATGYYYVATVAGTSSGTEPTWRTTVGTHTDGSVTWSLASLSGQEYNLYTPTSPVWVLGRYSQQMESAFTAAETLALQLGWHLRMRWDDGTSQWRPTFYEPDRDKTVPDFTLSEYHRRAVPSWGGTVDDLRNRVRVGYYDKDDLDPAGNAKLKEVIVEDTTSQEEYGGVYFMNFTPGAASNIDTEPEATRLANAALSDLSQPPVDVELDCPFMHHVELGDLLQVPPDGVHHDVAKDMSVTRVSKTLTGQKAGMTISLRGKPMVARAQWLVRQAQRGVALTRPENGPDAVTDLTVEPTAAGVAVSFVPSQWGRGAEEYELHLSTSSGFTPDDSTFYAKGKQTTFNVTDLAPGTTYYAKVVPREKGVLDKPGVRGTASSEESFTARYVEPRALQPRVTYAALPPNSDFEAANDPNAPPDTWEMVAGTWNTDAELETSLTATGGKAVTIHGTDIELGSQLVAVTGDVRYIVSGVTRTTATVPEVLAIEWFDVGFASISTDSESVLFSGFFGRVEFTATAPSSARFARVRIASGSTGLGDVTWDSVAFERLDAPQEATTVLDALDYLNSLTAYTTGGRGGVQYRKDSTGRVFVEGHVSGGSNVQVFALPTDYRPPYMREFIVATDIGTARISVNASGAVTIATGGSGAAWVSLSGVSFETS
jgi:hypothetical protein